MRPWLVTAIVLAVVVLIVCFAPMVTRPCAAQLLTASQRYAASSRSSTSALMRARDAGRAEGLLEAARMSFGDADIRRAAAVDVLDYQRQLAEVTGSALDAGSGHGGESRRRRLHA